MESRPRKWRGEVWCGQEEEEEERETEGEEGTVNQGGRHASVEGGKRKGKG